MPQVEDIKVLNIDEVPHAVEDLPEEIQASVRVFNEWNQDLADAHKRHAQMTAATQALSQQIINQVRQYKEAEAQAAAAEAAPEVANDEAPSAPEAAVTEVPAE